MTDAIDELIAREGGFVDHQDDRGGPTKYGITQGRLGEWRGVIATAEDVRELTRDEARTIYLAVYASKIERIEHHQDLYRLVLDMAVLSGPKTSIRTLQRALNVVAGAEVVDIDGVLGPQTAAALDRVAIPRVIQAIVAARILALIRVVEGDVSQLVFLEGWVTRTLAFLPEAGV